MTMTMLAVESTALRFAILTLLDDQVDAVTLFFTSLTCSTILTENIGFTVFLPEVQGKELYQHVLESVGLTSEPQSSLEMHPKIK
jgi:hypothetical protein